MAVSQTLTLKETKVDALANTSRVQILWKSQQTGESYNLNSRTAKYWITVNGKKTAYTVSYTLPLQTTQTILDKTITVAHREDGTATVKVETWMDTRISAGQVELSKSLTLTAIPRASTIGATDAFIESTAMIAVNRKSEAYTHSVAFTFGERTGFLDSAGNITAEEVKHTVTSIPFAVPALFYDDMTDRTSQICRLRCRTYKGDTQVGSDQTASFTISANPNLCMPEIAWQVKDVNPATLALTKDEDTLVRHVSTARCTITAQGKNGAHICSLRINGQETDGTLVVYRVTEERIKFEAEDSRGFVTAYTAPLSVLPYVPVTLNAQVSRTDPTSGNAILQAKGQCWAKNFGAAVNPLNAFYRINDGAWETANLSVKQDGLYYEIQTEISGLGYTNTGTVEIIVQDAFDKCTQTVPVRPGIPTFDWGETDFSFHVPVSVCGNTINNVRSPENDADAVNKAYADRKISIQKLWENEAPSKNFAAQTVANAFSAGEMALVFFAEGIDAGAQSFVLVEQGKSGRVLGKYGDYLTHRNVRVSEEGVMVSGGNRMLSYGQWSTTDKVLIPMSVYKVCGVLDLDSKVDLHAICGTFLCGEVVAGQ